MTKRRDRVAPCPGCGHVVALTAKARAYREHNRTPWPLEERCPWSLLRPPHPRPLSSLDWWEVAAVVAWQTAAKEKRQAKPKAKVGARARRRSSCPTGKRSYRTEEIAELAATALTRASLSKPRPPGRSWARPYTCPRCGRWHLTSLEAT